MSEDRFDVWARAFVARLVETGGIEIRPNSDVAARVATCLANGLNVATALVDHPGVDELLADDETIKDVLDATKPPRVAARIMKPSGSEAPPPEPPAPKQEERGAFPHLTPAARQLLVDAQKLAMARTHRDITLEHLLLVMLDSSILKMGGDPAAARIECERILRLEAAGESAAPEAELLDVIDAATEDAPNPEAVAPMDLAMAALAHEHFGFILAFRGRPPPPPRPDSEPPEDDAEAEVPPERAPGLLVVSAEFEQAFRYAAAVARKERDDWARQPARRNRVPASLIAAAEKELQTTFPDDFLAAAVAGITQFANLGVTDDEPHAEPAKGHQVAERILEVAAAAESEVPDSMVAIMALADPNDVTYVCIAKNVVWKGRNDQQVFLAPLGAELEPAGPFGALLLRFLRERFDEPKDDGKSPPDFVPRLAGD